MLGKQPRFERRWGAFGAAALVAAALLECSDATKHAPEPPPSTCPPLQTSYIFNCYTLAELQLIADAAARDSGPARADAAAESSAAGAAGDTGASTTGPLLFSCPEPDGNTYPPLSGFLDTPPPGNLPVSMPGECCYYRTFSFCAGI